MENCEIKFLDKTGLEKLIENGFHCVNLPLGGVLDLEKI